MVEQIRQGDIPGVQLRQRCRLPLTAEQAWNWLTDPALASRWLAQRVALCGESGDSLMLEGRFEGRTWIERGTVERVVPLRLWALAFERLEAGWPAPTRLVLELRPLASGCELSLLHEGFQRLALSECLTIWEFYRRRWRAALARLGEAAAAHAGEADPPPADDPRR